MYNSVRIIICVQFCLSLAQEGPCTGSSYKGCCSGTAWDNSLKKCVDCLPGYHGENCSELCEYPRYGMMCMNKCSCDNSSCDAIRGCLAQDISTNRDSTVFDNLGSFSSTIALNKSNASSFLFTTEPKSILKYLIIAFGSIGIGICFLYLCVYLIRESMHGETQQSPDNTEKNKNNLYQEIHFSA